MGHDEPGHAQERTYGSEQEANGSLDHCERRTGPVAYLARGCTSPTLPRPFQRWLISGCGRSLNLFEGSARYPPPPPLPPVLGPPRLPLALGVWEVTSPPLGATRQPEM